MNPRSMRSEARHPQDQEKCRARVILVQLYNRDQQTTNQTDDYRDDKDRTNKTCSDPGSHSGPQSTNAAVLALCDTLNLPTLRSFPAPRFKTRRFD